MSVPSAGGAADFAQPLDCVRQRELFARHAGDEAAAANLAARLEPAVDARQVAPRQRRSPRAPAAGGRRRRSGAAARAPASRRRILAPRPHPASARSDRPAASRMSDAAERGRPLAMRCAGCRAGRQSRPTRRAGGDELAECGSQIRVASNRWRVISSWKERGAARCAGSRERPLGSAPTAGSVPLQGLRSLRALSDCHTSACSRRNRATRRAEPAASAAADSRAQPTSPVRHSMSSIAGS